jgi:hypothetical protein
MLASRESYFERESVFSILIPTKGPKKAVSERLCNGGEIQSTGRTTGPKNGGCKNGYIDYSQSRTGRNGGWWVGLLFDVPTTTVRIGMIWS